MNKKILLCTGETAGNVVEEANYVSPCEQSRLCDACSLYPADKDPGVVVIVFNRLWANLRLQFKLESLQ